MSAYCSDVLDVLGAYFPACRWYRYQRFGRGIIEPPGIDERRPPVTKPAFCTGQQLWRLGMPRSVRPDDDRFERGFMSELIKAGVPTDCGGVRYAAFRRDVTIEHVLGAPGESLRLDIVGNHITVRLAGDESTTYAQLFTAIHDSERAQDLIAESWVSPGGVAPTLSDKTELPFGTGTLSLLQGMPTDNFGLILECTRSGFVKMDSAKGRIRPALFRLSLNLGETWTEPTPWPSDPIEPKSCGITFQLSDGVAKENPFIRGERFVLTTYQSEQFRDAIEAAAAEMVRFIAVSEVTPLLQWEKDLAEINAVLAAYSLMATGGFDATTTSRTEHNYDEELYRRNKDKRKDLAEIASAYQRLICKPSGEIPGVECTSEPPQGTGSVLM